MNWPISEIKHLLVAESVWIHLLWLKILQIASGILLIMDMWVESGLLLAFWAALSPKMSSEVDYTERTVNVVGFLIFAWYTQQDRRTAKS